jgi:hypothetical protein
MKFPLVLSAVLAVMAVEMVLAQPSAENRPPITDDIQYVCRTAMRKVCIPGSLPDFEAVRHCVKDSKDRSPAPCATLIAAMAQARQ